MTEDWGIYEYDLIFSNQTAAVAATLRLWMRSMRSLLRQSQHEDYLQQPIWLGHIFLWDRKKRRTKLLSCSFFQSWGGGIEFLAPGKLLKPRSCVSAKLLHIRKTALSR